MLRGPIARATHVVLAEDGGLADAIEPIRKQTERLIERVVSAYERDVARGEVGHGGSATASDEPPLHLHPAPGATGLVYGRIKSGMTSAMVSLVAHSLDNGFRAIIVLTSNDVALVDRTHDRFGVVHRARVVASTTADRWTEDVPNMKQHLPSRGLIIICSKNVRRLAKLRELLGAVHAWKHPTLILDDDARAPARAMNPSQVDPPRVSEEIQQIRTLVPHNVFLQVTATRSMMPSFTFVLEPGAGYVGGERFFSEEILDLESEDPAFPPLCLVPDDEPRALSENPDPLPVGLTRAIVLFLVAASARAVIEPSAYRAGQSFLCHGSHRVADYKAVAALIRRFLDELVDAIAANDATANSLFEWAYAELRRTADAIPKLIDIRDDIGRRLPNREVIVVNAEGDSLRPRPRVPNFIIGGDILGGPPIPNLLVTYHGRDPQMSPTDATIEHAGMFGYREALMPFTRVFLTPTLAAHFQAICIAEREFMQILRESSIPAQ